MCVCKLTNIVPDNGLSPDRRQAIIWINAGILLIRAPGTKFSEILSEIHKFTFKKMHLKISPAKWRPFCLGLNVAMLDAGWIHTASLWGVRVRIWFPIFVIAVFINHYVIWIHIKIGCIYVTHNCGRIECPKIVLRHVLYQSTKHNFTKILMKTRENSTQSVGNIPPLPPDIYSQAFST